jgi:hypothetical protein
VPKVCSDQRNFSKKSVLDLVPLEESGKRNAIAVDVR